MRDQSIAAGGFLPPAVGCRVPTGVESAWEEQKSLRGPVVSAGDVWQALRFVRVAPVESNLLGSAVRFPSGPRHRNLSSLRRQHRVKQPPSTAGPTFRSRLPASGIGGRRLMAIWMLVAGLAISTACGCRAIGRFGESRQSIAARRLSRQGLKAMRQGDWTIAENYFSEALDVSADNDAAHRGLSESLWQRGRTTQAIEHLERAVALSASDPKHLQRLGRMYLEVGRVEEAAAQCQAALGSDRDWAPLWALWGDVLSAQSRPEEALAAYHRALSLQPDYPQVQMRTAEIYHQQKRFDRLLATLDRYRDPPVSSGSELDAPVPPGRADLLRGIAMRELGRPEEAGRYFAIAARKNPADATPRMHLAALAESDGQTELAQAWREEASRVRLVTAEGETAIGSSVRPPSQIASRPDRSPLQ